MNTLWTLLLVPCLFAGCYKNFVPEEQDYFSRDANFNKTDFVVWLGSTSVSLYIFNADYSTQPLEFAISNCRRADTVYTADSTQYQIDTVAAPELRQEVPVQIWDRYYSGKETSIAEIEGKKHTANLPVLDIRPHSGDIFFYNTTADVVRPGKYFFDVQVKNSGGEQTYHMKLDVRLPHPYDPFDFDDITGKRLPVHTGGILHPTRMNGVVDLLGRNLPADSVNVWFHKVGSGGSNTLTIKFFDQDSLPIKLSNFNRMQWDSLRYYSTMTGLQVPFGFNRKMTADSTAVTWDIPNPFPVLSDVSGSLVHAAIDFTYNRVSFGKRVDAAVGMDFAIFEPGQWELIFKFRQNPKFGDD